MSRPTEVTWGALVCSLVLSGCAIPKKGGFTEVAALVEARAGQRVEWLQGAAEEAQVKQAVQALLAKQLSVDETVQIALLTNRSLQARYEELGLAQADLVQAGLLSNPVFRGSGRFSNRSSAVNTEFGVVQDFLNILLRPARKSLASADFEQAKFRVADAVLQLAAETKKTFYTLQGSVQTTEMLRVVAQAAQRAYEFALRQHQAGNINNLDLIAQQGLFESAKVELVISEAAVLADRERLTRLMGLWGMDTQWRISELLPDLPEQEVPLEHLESLAISQRLDLAAERWEVETLAKALKITVRWRYVPLIDVGVDIEKDTDGERVTGPNLTIQLPIFDQGQAKAARVEALLRGRQQRMASLAIEIRSEVRDARNRLRASRELAEHYRQVLIPLRERLVAESQRFYNYMLLGVYQLLQAKQDEIGAYRGSIEALRDYWVARSDLERAAGGELSIEEAIANPGVGSASAAAPKLD